MTLTAKHAAEITKAANPEQATEAQLKNIFELIQMEAEKGFSEILVKDLNDNSYEALTSYGYTIRFETGPWKWRISW